jgi:glycosyltransferase involved in cell wall biosynthesis
MTDSLTIVSAATSNFSRCLWQFLRSAQRAQMPGTHRFVAFDLGLAAGERAALEKEISELQVDAILTGHLPQEDVARWMRATQVFLLPSVREPFGLVLVEALACGCRAVAAATGGPVDIIDRQLIASGFASLVNPVLEGSRDDEERYVGELAAAVSTQLRRTSDDQSRSSIAETVRNRTWDHVYARMRDLYLQLAG